MRYRAITGQLIDTDRDFDEAQRHVAQKLMAWESLGLPPAEFRGRLERAMLTGWNNQGPARDSAALRAMADDLQRRLAIRLGLAPPPDWFWLQPWPGRFGGGGLRLLASPGGVCQAEVLDAADQLRGVLESAEASSLKLMLEDIKNGGALARQLAKLGLRPR